MIDVGDAMFVDGRSASQALPSSLGGCVLLLYRYIIIANCFFLFSGVLGRDHLVFSLSLALLFLLRGWVGCTHTWIHPQDGSWETTTSAWTRSLEQSNRLPGISEGESLLRRLSAISSSSSIFAPLPKMM